MWWTSRVLKWSLVINKLHFNFMYEVKGMIVCGGGHLSPILCPTSEGVSSCSRIARDILVPMKPRADRPEAHNLLRRGRDMAFETQMPLTGYAIMTPRERVWVGENSYISLSVAVVTTNKGLSQLWPANIKVVR